MKSYKKISLFLFSLALGLVTSSCGDNFLSTKPEDTISLSNFYTTNQQVQASTNILYGAPWFQYNDKFSWAVSEMLSGNGRSYSDDITGFGSFSETADNDVLLYGWQSLWTVVAQSNALITNLPDRTGGNVDQATLNNALGEAHVMRAMAYFFLVRLWGGVPIIENNLDYVYSPKVPRNPVDDVYKFIRQDLQFGIDNCLTVASGLNNGHVTSGSAKALLAKVALTRGDYATARQLSEEVINSGEFQLMDNYADLFKTANNNNLETIIALQWSDKGTSNGYGHGNSRQAYFAYNSQITGTPAGYGVLGPTIDLQNDYENGDQRLKPTLMLPGFHYNEILSSDGGYTAPDDISAQGTGAAIKKYVIGTPADNNGVGKKQARTNNTYLLRYADVLLIHAEAILGDVTYGSGASTSDPAALKSFNAVRKRAGLGMKTAITKKDIIHERRIEFAIEDSYWYDLLRIDRNQAIQLISNQERGTYANIPKGNPPEIYTINYTPDNGDFTLPFPSVDVAVNDFLTQEPQPYDFGEGN